MISKDSLSHFSFIAGQQHYSSTQSRVRQPVSTHQLSSIPSTAGVSRLPRSRKKTGAQDHLRDEKEAFSFPLLTSRVQKTSLHVSSHNRSISLYIALDCFKSHPVHYGRYVLGVQRASYFSRLEPFEPSIVEPEPSPSPGSSL